MSYGGQAFGRLAIAQGQGEFLLVSFAGRTRCNLGGAAGLTAQAAVGSVSRMQFRGQASAAAVAGLVGRGMLTLVGQASTARATGLAGRLRSRVSLSGPRLRGNNVLVVIQVINRGPVVVAGTMTETVL